MNAPVQSPAWALPWPAQYDWLTGFFEPLPPPALAFPELPDWYFEDDHSEDPEPIERIDPQTGFVECVPCR